MIKIGDKLSIVDDNGKQYDMGTLVTYNSKKVRVEIEMYHGSIVVMDIPRNNNFDPAKGIMVLSLTDLNYYADIAYSASIFSKPHLSYYDKLMSDVTFDGTVVNDNDNCIIVIAGTDEIKAKGKTGNASIDIYEGGEVVGSLFYDTYPSTSNTFSSMYGHVFIFTADEYNELFKPHTSKNNISGCYTPEQIRRMEYNKELAAKLGVGFQQCDAPTGYYYKNGYMLPLPRTQNET